MSNKGKRYNTKKPTKNTTVQLVLSEELATSLSLLQDRTQSNITEIMEVCINNFLREGNYGT